MKGKKFYESTAGISGIPQKILGPAFLGQRIFQRNKWNVTNEMIEEYINNHSDPDFYSVVIQLF